LYKSQHYRVWFQVWTFLEKMVSDYCLMPTQQFFSYILARMRFSMKWWWGPLCTRPTRLVGFLVLVHWNSRPQIDKSPHSDTLSWFRANQSLLLVIYMTLWYFVIAVSVFHILSSWENCICVIRTSMLASSAVNR
jgi:hypothetical protein